MSLGITYYFDVHNMDVFHAITGILDVKTGSLINVLHFFYIIHIVSSPGGSAVEVAEIYIKDR